MSGERLPYPTERDILDAREENLRLDLETAFPARVQSYDPDAQTADLVPLIRRQVPQGDDSYAMEALPVLPSVPVCFPRVGTWFLSFPVAQGDTGIVVVCSGAIGHWRVGDGDVSDPGDLRRHHPSHAIFLPMGLVPRSRALAKTGAAGESVSTGLPTGVVLGSDNANGPRVLIRANGAVEIETGGATAVRVDANGTVNLGAASGAAFAARADLVNAIVSSLKEAVATWVPVPNDGGASLKTVIAGWSPSSVAATKAKVT